MKENKSNTQKGFLQTSGQKKFKQAKATTICSIVAVSCLFLTLPVFASGDPLGAINNLSDFFFAAIKAIGLIITGIGVVTLGLSFKSHDPSQRANGIMGVFGGLLIAFAKDILDLIVS